MDFSWLVFVRRMLEGILDACNREKKRSYADDSADAISNGGSVQHSEQSFSDLANKSKRDQTE
ncbi:hypothetical protein [Vibrio sp. TBV020]|uniref:hypothetical protein n=1 Tax=Vibrio sp. TBV020 TaxID=3137398 RepID=UPI0038CD24DD